MLRAASMEITVHDRAAIPACREALGDGRTVYITHLPRRSPHEMVAAAVDLRRAGMVPVPHIAARRLASFSELADYLARASGEAGVDHALVIGGDRDRPAGPYSDSLQVLASGLFEKHGFRTIGLAAYPEPHPRIATSVLESMLRAKMALVRQSGMQAEIITQFCFDAGPILAWLQREKEHRLDVPVRIGLAGPASIATLAKFAVRCGVGTSLLALLGGQTSIARLIVESGPERIVRAVAEEEPTTPAHRLHFFSFGGVPKTAEWMRAIAAGEFSLSDDAGFRVNPR